MFNVNIDYINILSFLHLDLVRVILKKTKRNFTGQSLARIAVEVEEEEDVRRVVESGTVDWNERSRGEDPPIFWALNNERFEKVKILLKCPGMDLKMKDRNNCSLEKIARLVFSEIKIPYPYPQT